MGAAADRVASGRCAKICIADLNKKCSIENRQLKPPKIKQSKPTVKFTTIFKGWFKVKTIRGTSRFANVNINKSATHICITRFSTKIVDLDGDGENFITRGNLRLKILEITNVDESDRWLLFHCTERGLDSKEESDA
jgi:hypothetical protein